MPKNPLLHPLKNMGLGQMFLSILVIFFNTHKFQFMNETLRDDWKHVYKRPCDTCDVLDLQNVWYHYIIPKLDE
jgi:uncharacterized membrane protein YwaF